MEWLKFSIKKSKKKKMTIAISHLKGEYSILYCISYNYEIRFKLALFLNNIVSDYWIYSYVEEMLMTGENVKITDALDTLFSGCP